MRSRGRVDRDSLARISYQSFEMRVANVQSHYMKSGVECVIVSWF